MQPLVNRALTEPKLAHIASILGYVLYALQVVACVLVNVIKYLNLIGIHPLRRKGRIRGSLTQGPMGKGTMDEHSSGVLLYITLIFGPPPDLEPKNPLGGPG